MSKMKKLISRFTLIFFVMFSSASFAEWIKLGAGEGVLPRAQSEKLYFTVTSETDQLPEKMIEDGIDMILDALQLFIQKMPNYEKPEILENGDIIIRRVKPDQGKPSENDDSLGKPNTRI